MGSGSITVAVFSALVGIRLHAESVNKKVIDVAPTR
jgi:hypothetical protein